MDTSANQRREGAHRAENETDDERMKDDETDYVRRERHKEEQKRTQGGREGIDESEEEDEDGQKN